VVCEKSFRLSCERAWLNECTRLSCGKVIRVEGKKEERITCFLVHAD
jgi:hypothetical protein